MLPKKNTSPASMIPRYSVYLHIISVEFNASIQIRHRLATFPEYLCRHNVNNCNAENRHSCQVYVHALSFMLMQVAAIELVTLPLPFGQMYF